MTGWNKIVGKKKKKKSHRRAEKVLFRRKRRRSETRDVELPRAIKLRARFSYRERTCVVSTVSLGSPVCLQGRGGEEKKKEAKEREQGRASFHRETKIAVINGPELWTRGAFF